MHPLVKLAKDTIELYVRERKIFEAEEEAFPEEFRQQAGVFVCLKSRGALRGCIGTLMPCEPTIVREIVRNAVSAAISDPRFPPVRPDELDRLEYSVDVLTRPEPVSDRSTLDPRRFGVIVQSGGRRGLLLPDLDGVDTIEQQLSIAMQKAWIPAAEKVEIFKFEVKRYR